VAIAFDVNIFVLVTFHVTLFSQMYVLQCIFKPMHKQESADHLRIKQRTVDPLLFDDVKDDDTK